MLRLCPIVCGQARVVSALLSNRTCSARLTASSTQRRKMLALLDQVSFSHEPVQPPDWEYFNPAQVDQVRHRHAVTESAVQC